MIVQASFTLTPKEYSEANKLLLLNTLTLRKLNLIFALWVAPAIGILLIFFSVSTLIARSTRNASVWILLFLGLFWALSPLLFHRRVNKHYKEQKLGRTLHLKVDEDRFEIRYENGDAETSYRWQAFEKCVESDRIFILVPSSRQFVPIPKRVFSAEQVRELRALFAMNIRSERPRN